MTNTKDSESGPIEVWLRQSNLTITCTVVYEDEHTDELDVSSLSIRGAERELTGWALRMGYTPATRWGTEAAAGDEPGEVMRRFKPAS